MRDERQYLLPSPGEEDAEIKCCIIFYPDHPAYRRALWGSLDYLGSWIAWERDEEHRGTVAAKLWKSANEQTWECFDMGCFDDLITAIENIKLVQQFQWDCNCGIIVIVPPNPIIPPITYNEGDPPETYGEIPIDDWSHWRRVVCANADAYVDLLISENNHLQTLITLGAIGITVIGTIMGILFSGGLALAVGAGAASAVLAGLIQLGTGAAFATFEEDIESIREDIRCAIVCSLDLTSLIQSTIDEDAWNYFYRFADWSKVSAIIRSGELEGQFLDGSIESNDCDDCDCPITFSLEYDFTAASGPVSGIDMSYTGGVGWAGNVADGGGDGIQFLNNALETAIGVSDGTTLQINRIKCIYQDYGGSFVLTQNWTIQNELYGGATLLETKISSIGPGGNVTIDYDDIPVHQETNLLLKCHATTMGNIGGSQRLKIVYLLVEGLIIT